MKQAAILTGILLIGIGLVGYFSQWIEMDAQATQVESGQSQGDLANGGDPSGDNPASGDPASRDPEDKSSKGPSLTALIPAGLGLLILLCGLVAINEGLRKHAMHAAAGFSLLGGLAGLGRGIPGLISILNDDPEVNRRAVIFVWLMALVCFGFLFLAINSFIAARKSRETGK